MTESAEDEIKGAAANVANRLTKRPEERPDPRNRHESLGSAVSRIVDLQMVREATAFVLVYDVFSKPPDPREIADRLVDARMIAGPALDEVMPFIDPRVAEPAKVAELAELMAARLTDIGDFDVGPSLAD